MCDNCAPNVYKLKERAQYWYGVLTTDKKQEMIEQQKQQDIQKTELFSQMYPQLTDKERDKKLALAQLGCSLSLKSYLFCQQELKKSKTDQQQPEITNCDDIVENIRSCVNKSELDLGYK